MWPFVLFVPSVTFLQALSSAVTYQVRYSHIQTDAAKLAQDHGPAPRTSTFVPVNKGSF